MSSGNGPPSFSSSNGTNISGYVGSTDDAQFNNNQPPSYNVATGRAGNSFNQIQNVNTNRELGQTDTPKPPSFTTALERERNSHAYTGNLKYESGNVGGQAPSLSHATARDNHSHPSGGVEHEGSAPPPNISATARENHSHPSGGGDSSMVIEGSDAQDYVGMSLVGKNFRRFYPNAYYKGKDADN